MFLSTVAETAPRFLPLLVKGFEEKLFFAEVLTPRVETVLGGGGLVEEDSVEVEFSAEGAAGFSLGSSNNSMEISAPSIADLFSASMTFHEI